jgi:hypothetical protein
MTEWAMTDTQSLQFFANQKAARMLGRPWGVYSEVNQETGTQLSLIREGNKKNCLKLKPGAWRKKSGI